MLNEVELPAGQVVKNHDAVPSSHESVNQMRANKAGSAGHQCSHTATKTEACINLTAGKVVAHGFEVR